MGHIRSEFSYKDFSGSLYIYDIKTDNWKTSDLKFRERAYHNIYNYKDRIYVLGGKRLSPVSRFEFLDEKIEVYDIKRDTILLDNVNPHQAVNFASFLYKNVLIVIGGSVKLNIDEEKIFTGKAHSFYHETGYWYELNDMPDPKETKGVLIDSTLYLIGGFNRDPLNEIESYNLVSAEWKIEGQLFYKVERPAVTYNEDIIYIFDDGKIQTYNIKTKELNMYLIDLPLRSGEMFYANNIDHAVEQCGDSSRTTHGALTCVDACRFYGALIVQGNQSDELAIVPGSPADNAGLSGGDIILELGGERITVGNTLAEIILKYNPGDEIVLKILRDGEELDISLTLVRRED